MSHHNLDVHPIPNKPHLFINELDLIDPNAYETKEQLKRALEHPSEDTIRVYIPLDLSYDLILRRLKGIEEPDMYKRDAWYCSEFRSQVMQIVKQMEIYDQIRDVRNMSISINTNTEEPGHNHSPAGIQLAGEIVKYMEYYEDIFEEEIIELKKEYGL